MRLRLLLVFIISSLFASAQTNKLSTSLSSRLSGKLSGKSLTDTIHIIISVMDSVPGFSNAKLIEASPSSGVYHLRTIVSEVLKMDASRAYVFIDEYIVPKEELTTGSLDLATNYVNLAHHRYPLVTGDNLLISIKENRFDTTDIDLVKRYVNTFLASPSVTAHATIMATTAAGAGNSSPYGKGVAHKANLTSSDFFRILPDPDTSFIKYGITVQNHSYGTAIQNYYGAEARAYDVNTNDHRHLVHVFSSGNSGASAATSGIYAGINRFANLTGNFKWSKNTLSAGAIDSFYNVASLSSRGPAPDGRIKPELVAFGQDGSSGAAAMVSGTALLVQHAYQSQHGGALPPSSLTKAVLVNAAKDVGTVGIDFTSGYGALDAHEAVKTVMEGRIHHDSLSAGQTISLPVTVPANTALFKASVAWTDPAASVNAPRSLVHDLDAVIRNSSTGETWMPWILNTKPHADSLKLPAVRGKDTLNPVEQITVAHPVPGNYLIEIKAPALTTSKQAFSISWQIDTVGHFQWSYPAASDKVSGGAVNIIRWQSNIASGGTIEYAQGNNWITVGSVADARKGFFEWQAPDSFFVTMLRFKSGGNYWYSDSFVVSGPVMQYTAFNCADSFMVYWDKKPVTHYQVYMLSGKYLQPFAIVSDTFHVFQRSQFSSDYIAVAPIVGGQPGIRSTALNYAQNGVGCYFRNFYLQSTSGRSAFFFASLGTTTGVQSVALQKLVNGSYVTITTIASPSFTDFNLTDSALVRGTNLYRLQISLQNGKILYSDVVSAYYFGNEDVIVYPNPVKRTEQLYLLSNKAGRQTISIYNSAGLLVYEKKIKDIRQGIPTWILSPGVYFIHVIDDEGKRTKEKLVVY